MRSVRTSTAWIGLALITGGVPLLAQLQDNSEKQLTCANGGYDNDRARHCEIREQSLPSIGRLSMDAGQNGGATIKGWLRGDVLVRARVEASGENEGAAAIMASRVMVDGSGGQVRATGPESANNSWWSVSYEIFVPQVTDLTLKTNNGGITVSDVRGQIHFDAVNGGVHLKRVVGDVTGATVNGGIEVELAGAMLGWAADGTQHPQRRRHRRHAGAILRPHPGRNRNGPHSVGFPAAPGPERTGRGNWTSMSVPAVRRFTSPPATAPSG